MWLSDDNKTLPDVQKYKHMKIHKKNLENALYDTSNFLWQKATFKILLVHNLLHHKDLTSYAKFLYLLSTKY